MTIQQILIKYWGYPQFRPLQEEVIQSALDGHDTLALLPTGGGKSICFQVPVMAREGIGLVISPLIALMKDQVENLRKKNIPALSITSGMSKREIDITLDNAAYGHYKFLYVSPERIQTELFKERLKKMPVNLIAVDEAHCISQWGYDFRPSYLTIADLREIKPEIPILALTATATPIVVEDIQEKLRFAKKNVLQKSFERKNLSYVVLQEADKRKKLLNIINSVAGTGIVYTDNRRKTKEVAEFLSEQGISADYYHAGLDHLQRSRKQEDWTSGKTRVMVSTNAFGMGIDQPHVRFVIHVDLPDSLEAYFQEAGRAGRDEKKAFAVMLYNATDQRRQQEKAARSFPPIEVIKRVYLSLGNYFQLAVGSGLHESFDFELSAFCERYQFKQQHIVYNALIILEREGYLTLSESILQPSKIHASVAKEELYRFQVKNQEYDLLIKTLLRSYTGIFDGYSAIQEDMIAKRCKFSQNRVREMLVKLDELDLFSFIPRNSHPKITYLMGRVDQKSLVISQQHYFERKKLFEERSERVWHYVSNTESCRSMSLLSYFGEVKSTRCGICDVCLERNKMEVSELEFESISNSIKEVLSAGSMTLEKLVDQTPVKNKEKVLKVIQWLLEHGHLERNKIGHFTWGA